MAGRSKRPVPRTRTTAASLPARATPIRLLTAVPICDGHDSAISTINLELTRQGMEVVYLGYNRSARDVVRAAVQEDVRAVGISSYNGGHVEYFREVAEQLKEEGAGEIGLFGGGGGTITRGDARLMRKHGVDEIFFPGTPLEEIVRFVRDAYGPPRPRRRRAANGRGPCEDLRLARLLSAAENGEFAPTHLSTASTPRTIGITGPGGAGKTTLIDELVLRRLRAHPDSRIAILSHDPSILGNGALLGDRAAMIYAQDDRVFMRSLGTRGQAGGVAAATAGCLAVLQHAIHNGGSVFDLILVETVGIGQEAMPLADDGVDCRVLVMSPDYGSRLQLQKIAMLDAADIIVVNKADLGGAPAARAEIEQRLAANARGQRLLSAVAKRHGDAGVDELYGMLE